MSKEEFAKLLDGREYGEEITPREENLAKDSGLIVIFCASDDLCELRGVINDEIGAYRECMIFISKSGNLLPEVEDEDTETLKKYGALGFVQELHRNAVKVTANFGKDGFTWTYETVTPHATFVIMEGAETYCRGLVISMADLAST